MVFNPCALEESTDIDRHKFRSYHHA